MRIPTIKNAKFQGIIFIGKRTFGDIFKSALVYLSWGIKFPQQNINQSEIELVIRICQWNCCQSWKAVARRCSVKKVFLNYFFLFHRKTLWHRCFPVNFVKFLRTPFSVEQLLWLLLNLFQKTFIPNTHSEFLC